MFARLEGRLDWHSCIITQFYGCSLRKQCVRRARGKLAVGVLVFGVFAPSVRPRIPCSSPRPRPRSMPFQAVTAPAPRLAVSTARPWEERGSHGQGDRHPERRARSRGTTGASRARATPGETRAPLERRGGERRERVSSLDGCDRERKDHETHRASIGRSVAESPAPSRRGALVGGGRVRVRGPSASPAHARATAVVRADPCV